jgi:TRAP-type C4-dicarboxylate transport system permease small subunit
MPKPPDLDALPDVIGDDGQFSSQDEQVDLSATPIESWAALIFFWALGLTVFYQFFTRYLLNDSAAWTEEIARYLLISTVFTGAAIGVAKNNHIQVDFFYRFLPAGAGRLLALLVDSLRIGFFGAAVVMTWQLMQKLGNAKMTVVDWPINVVYAVCMVGFAAMFARSVWVMRLHLRRGYSVLERPESAMSDH